MKIFKFGILIIFITTINAFGQKLDKKTKKYLKYKLDSIGQFDQKYRWELTFGELDRKKIDSLNKLPNKLWEERVRNAHEGKVGFNQATRDSLNKLQNKLDSLNIIAFSVIINKYGYPSYKRVKSYTTYTLTLHLMGKNNFEKFLPIFKTELENGNMPANEYAAWYDRNLRIAGKKQLFGEYITEYPCVENLERTNLERKNIGLKPIKKNNCKNS